MSSSQRPGASPLLLAIKLGWATTVMVAAIAIAIRPTLLDPVFVGHEAAAEARQSLVVVSDPASAAAAAKKHARARIINVLPADGSKYFGVALTDATPSRPDPSGALVTAIGTAPTLQMTFEDFTNNFDVSKARALTAAGRLPMFTWEPFDHDAPTMNPYPLARIAAGDFDAYLREQGRRLAALDAPIVVRFAHEMNGGWYPWGVTASGNTAAAYIAAYRHVHDVVTAAGATNVVWMWAPNMIDGDPSVALATVYPGDDVVDWVGLSGYYTGPQDTFIERFGPTMAQVDAVAPARPVIIAETSVQRSASRSAQITELINGVRSTPRFIGFVWFDMDKRARWSVEDDPAAAAALGAAVRAGGFGARPEPVATR